MSGPPPSKRRKPNDDEEVEEDDNDDGNDSANEKDTSEKKGKNLKSFLHGITYQQKLLLLTLFCGVENHDEFSLSTEEEMADKFDDVVYKRLINSLPNITFLQAKHLQNDAKQINFNELISKNSKDKFSLGKYFLSYLSIIKNYKDSNIEKLILCSNIDLSKKSFEDINIEIKSVDENLYKKEGFNLFQLVQTKTADHENDKCPTVLIEYLENASELSQLAGYLVSLSKKPKQLSLRSYLFKRYHVALFTKNVLERVDDKTAKFHPTFFDGSRKDDTFYKMFKNLYEKRGRSMKNLSKIIFTKVANFGSDLLSIPLTLDDQHCEAFADEIISLMNSNKEVPLYKKRTDEDITKGFIEMLAGRVLFYTNVKDTFKFHTSFCEESQESEPGSSNTEILKLKNIIVKKLKDDKKSLHDLKIFRMRILKYYAYPENIMPYTSFVDEKNDINEIQNFFKKLYLLKTPNDDDLVKVLNQHLKMKILKKQYFDVSFSRAFMSDYIFNWMKEKFERPVNKKEALEKIQEMKQKLTVLEFAGTNSRYCGKLKDYGVSFAPDEKSQEIQEKIKTFLDESNKKKTFLLLTDYYLFGALKMLQILEDKDIDNYVFDNAVILNSHYESLKLAFHSKSAVNLVIVVCKDEELFDTSNFLENVGTNKKIIIISKNVPTDDFDENVKDNTNIKHFDDPETKILKRNVKFQGNPNVSLNNLLENNVDIVDNATLFKLVKNKNKKNVLEIGKAPEIFLGYVENYFIERSFNQNIAYDIEVLKQASSIDLFIIETETYPLSETNENVKIVNSLSNIPSTFYGLNTHLFKKRGEKLIWEKSIGSIDLLLKQKRENICLWNYDEIFKKSILIISNVAGMGKSTLLTSMIFEYKKKFPTIWVVRINISKYLCLFDKKNNSKKIIDNMLENEFQTHFEKNLFWHNCRQNKVLTIFDGYDEIDSKNHGRLIEVIAELKDSKIWITSRTYLQNKLEQLYKVFSLSIQPFNEFQQIKFLLRYWKMNYKKQMTEAKDKLMKKYAETIVEKFCQNINDNINSFGTIPLQLKMLAEYFQDNEENDEKWDKCFDFIEKETDEEPNLPVTLNLYNLYKMFVDKKIKEIYLREKNGVHRRDIEDSVKKEKYKLHETLALKTLLTNENLKIVFLKNDYDKINETMKAENIGTVGIITEIEDNKINFVHLTFAEYFAANVLTKKLLLNGSSSSQIEKLFQIIDAMIPMTSSVFVTCMAHIFNDKLRESESLLSGKSLTTYAVTNNYFNLFKAVVENGLENFLPKDNHNKTPLHYVAENKNIELIEFLLTYNNDLLENEILKHGKFIKPEHKCSKLVKYVNLKDTFDKTALTYAKEKEHMRAICKLLLNGANVAYLEDSLKDVILYITSKTHKAYADQHHEYRPIVELLLLRAPDVVKDLDPGYRFPRLLSYFFVHGRLEVISKLMNSLDEEKLFFNIKKFKLLNNDDNSYTPLDRVNSSSQITDSERLEISKYLIKNNGTTVKKRVLWCTDDCPVTNVLQAAARDGHIKTFEEFLSLEIKENFYIHLATACDYKQCNVIRFLLQKSQHIYHDGNNPLHTAADRNLHEKFVNEQFLGKYDINGRNDSGETPIFMAIKAKSELSQIRNLVEKGAQVNISIDDAKREHDPELESFLSYISEPLFSFNKTNIEDKIGILILSVVGESEIEMSALDARKNNCQIIPKTPLELAITNELDSVVKYFLLICNAERTWNSSKIMFKYYQNPEEYDLNANDNEVLKSSINDKDEFLCKFIIKNGKNINTRTNGGKILMQAFNVGLYDVVNLLMQYGVIYEGEIPIKEENWLYGTTMRFRSLTMSKLFADTQLLHDRNVLYKIEDLLVYILNVKNAQLQTMLHAAVEQKNLKSTIYLVEKNNEFLKSKEHGSVRCKDYISKAINEKDCKNRTPLEIAISNDSYDIAVVLLENGAWFDDVNVQVEHFPNSKLTKLMHLISTSFILVKEGKIYELKELLLQNKLPLKCIDKYGNNLLHYAVLIDDTIITCEFISYLIQMECHMNIVDNFGKTILFYVIQKDRLELLKLLLHNMPFISISEFEYTNENSCKEMINKLYSLFYFMIYYDEAKFLEEWSKEKNDFNILCNAFKYDFTLFHHAVDRSYCSVVKIFLQNGATITDNVENLAKDENIKSMFHWMKMFFGNSAKLKEKFEKKIAEKVKNKEISYGIITNVRRYEMPFANKPARAITLLHKAAWLGELKTVKWLIEIGANINVLDNFGCTPKMLAEESGQNEIVEYFESIKTIVQPA